MEKKVKKIREIKPKVRILKEFGKNLDVVEMDLQKSDAIEFVDNVPFSESARIMGGEVAVSRNPVEVQRSHSSSVSVKEGAKEFYLTTQTGEARRYVSGGGVNDSGVLPEARIAPVGSGNRSFLPENQGNSIARNFEDEKDKKYSGEMSSEGKRKGHGYAWER